MQSTKLTGPPGLPVLGNIREFMRNPLKFFERCAREYGDLVSIQFGGIPGVLVVHPDMIREVMVTQHKSMIKGRGTKRLEPLLGNSLLVAEHEDHKRLRRLSQPSFSKRTWPLTTATSPRKWNCSATPGGTAPRWICPAR